MTHTPRDLFPPSTECDEQVGIPDVRPNLEPDQERNADTFAQRFSRCHEMLQFIACRILSSVDLADRAVRNCRLTASRNTPTFENEGAFKSWLVRILIDEATLLLHRKCGGAPSSKPHSEVF